ncbi:MAG: ATP synthase F1 subunit gamma, partial [Betaproteobacteria bacterium]|nr:ATP synthase F1 subunit gamma [Betaproteobacteria bacterium]
RHPYLVKHSERKAAGMILVTTDKGLCGGLNTNVLRAATQKLRELQQDQLKVQATAIGNKGLGFLGRVGVPVVSHVVQLGDTPHLERLIGAVKVQLDAYVKGEIDVVYLAYTRFINTMKQEPVIEQLLPLTADRLGNVQPRKYGWDYLYEPDAVTVLDELLTRFIEALVYGAVSENMASEQSARMVAMKAASDNAKKVIDDLQLSYNKARQASITKELSEIVGGAAAV